MISITGFHGTALDNIDKILQDGFKSEKRDDHWLGQGIYFYSEYDLALWWIKRKITSTYGHGCAVIQAQIECDVENFLDLDIPKQMDYFLGEADKILNKEIRSKSFRFHTDSKSRERNFCFLLDLFKHLRNIQVVAMTFQRKNPSYAEENLAGFQEKYFPLPFSVTYRERQICAVSNDFITSKTCVFPEERTKWS